MSQTNYNPNSALDYCGITTRNQWFTETIETIRYIGINPHNQHYAVFQNLYC
jgi:hypothetical protein